MANRNFVAKDGLRIENMSLGDITNDLVFIDGEGIVKSVPSADVFSSSTITGYNKDNWDTAYSWGDHSQAGYLTEIPNHTHNYLSINGGTLNGDLIANSFIKADSSNSEILLGGGDTKPVSDFSLDGHNHDDRYWNLASGGTYATVDWDTLNPGDRGLYKSDSLNKPTFSGSFSWGQTIRQYGSNGVADSLQLHYPFRNSGSFGFRLSDNDGTWFPWRKVWDDTNLTDISQLNNDAGYLTSVNWGDVSGKPSTFTPSEHQHNYSELINTPKTNLADRLLIYYGYPIAYNNLWDVNPVVAEISANYDIYVVGQGYQDPTHEEYASTQAIIEGVRANGVTVYGYVPLGLNTYAFSVSELTTKVNQWNTLNVDGIFIDEFGFDYNDPTTPVDFRQRQVDVVNHVHFLNLNYVANSWEFGWVLFDTLTEVSQQYSSGSWVYDKFVEGNPNNTVLPRNENDIFLFENWAVTNTGLQQNWGVNERGHLFDQYNTDNMQKWAVGVLPENPAGTLDNSYFTDSNKPQTLDEISEWVWGTGLVHGMNAIGVHGYSFGSGGGTTVFHTPSIVNATPVTTIGDRIQPYSYDLISSRYFDDLEIKIDFNDYSLTYNGDTQALLSNSSIKPYLSNKLRGSYVADAFVKDGGTSSQFLMADGTTKEESSITIEQDNTVRVIYINPIDLPENYTKQDVVDNLLSTGFTKGDIETLIIKIIDGDWSDTYVSDYNARVTSEFGMIENVDQLSL